MKLATKETTKIKYFNNGYNIYMLYLQTKKKLN